MFTSLDITIHAHCQNPEFACSDEEIAQAIKVGMLLVLLKVLGGSITIDDVQLKELSANQKAQDRLKN